MMNFTEGETTHRNNISSSASFMSGLQRIYIPCLAFFGITGNLICAVVFTTKFLKRIRSSSYLFLLAISDLFFLIDLLPGWINTNIARSLYQDIRWICEIQTYISFVAAFIHIWMVLAFTAERCFAVNFPLKHMSKCTSTFSRTIILILVVPACLFYIYPSFYASNVDETGQCREKRSHVRYLTYINTIDMILTMLIPFLVVSILNLLIIRKLFCSKEFRQHVFQNGSSCQYRTSERWIENEQRTFSFDSVSSIRGRNKFQHHQRHVLTEVRLTKMLLAISLTCLLLNFPSYYSRWKVFYDQSESELNDDEMKKILHREILFHYMSYLSYAINIFIYILFGANFRRAVQRLVFSKRSFSPAIQSPRYSGREKTFSHQNSATHSSTLNKRSSPSVFSN